MYAPLFCKLVRNSKHMNRSFEWSMIWKKINHSALKVINFLKFLYTYFSVFIVYLDDLFMLIYHNNPPKTLVHLHWLPVIFHEQFRVKVMTYKALHDLGPWYLLEHLSPKNPATRFTHTSQSTMLKVATLREAKQVTTWNRTFSVVAPLLWNKFPSKVHQSPSCLLYTSPSPRD